MASFRVRSALLAGLLLVGLARAQSRPVPELTDYAVLGLGDVTIRAGSRVASGAVGSIGGTVRLGRQARVTNVVAAPTVRLGPAAHAGTVFCHFVSGPPTLPTCNAFVDPLVDPALLAPVAVTPGASDLHLPAHTGTAPVPAGSFRDVTVGRGSVLQLVSATIFAPAGDVILGSRGSYRGAVVGRTVVVAPEATVRVDSAL